MKRIVILSLILFSIMSYCLNEDIDHNSNNELITISNATTNLKEVFDSNNISFDEVNLEEEGDNKTIEFELENNSNYDAVIDILINGQKEYSNEYINIKCSNINEIKKHSKAKGVITITLIKQPEEDQNIDYNIEIKANQKM